MNYLQAIEYLESLPNPERWKLGSPRKLARLSRTHFNYEIVHVAGTNGKGSACAFLSSILQGAGYKTGIYTSPHLQRYNERIKIDGKEISNREFAAMIERIKPHSDLMRSEGFPPSLFEALTVAAFTHFSSKKIDFLVLETGLGGRLDATNIAPSRIQVITSISMDHAANLGNSISKIASEKAGIIKKSSAVITASLPSEALQQIRRKCKGQGASLSSLGKDFAFSEGSLHEGGGSFSYSGRHVFRNLRIPLPGKHQFENASLAVAAAEALGERGYAIPEAAIRRGLQSASWPARLEILEKRPLVLLDGAHNAGGMLALKESLQTIYLKQNRRLILILAIMGDKEYAKMISLISPLASLAIYTRASIPRSATPGQLLSAHRKLGLKIPCKAFGTIPEALDYARHISPPDGLICIAGSLYAAGEARAYLLNGEKTPPIPAIKGEKPKKVLAAGSTKKKDF